MQRPHSSPAAAPEHVSQSRRARHELLAYTLAFEILDFQARDLIPEPLDSALGRIKVGRRNFGVMKLKKRGRIATP